MNRILDKMLSLLFAAGSIGLFFVILNEDLDSRSFDAACAGSIIFAIAAVGAWALELHVKILRTRLDYWQSRIKRHD